MAGDIMTRFTVVDCANLVHLRGHIDAVLLTATPVELDATLALIVPLPDGRLVKTYIFSETYYVGRYGACTVVVVRCDTGTSGRDAALIVAHAALEKWRPRAIVMLGIAFGKDPERQGLCDVLVSKHLIPYELAKIGRKYQPRASHPPSDALLLNRFSNATDWTFLHRKRKVEVLVGPVLTGEKVMDNATAKARLFKLFPDAIGGEMEGAGLFAAAARHSTPWILVKAICDWGDGTKQDTHQRDAARAAASLVHHVLSEETSLRDLPCPAPILGVNPFGIPASSLTYRADSALSIAPVATQLEAPPSAPANAVSAEGTRAVLRALNHPKKTVAGSSIKHNDRQTEPGGEHDSVLAALSTNDARVLHLLCVAPCPIPLGALKALFPRERWSHALAALRRRRILGPPDARLLEVSRAFRLAAAKNTAAHEAAKARWTQRLEELSAHSDMAILLGLVYLDAKRPNDAVEALTSVASGLEPGSENEIYRELLSRMMTPKFFRRLEVDKQVHLLNGVALCTARLGNYRESLRLLARLASISRRAKHSWGEGQAYINSGVDYYHLSEVSKARRCYERAIDHANRTDDPWLLGRALHNLGMIVLDSEPDRGLALIEQGLEVKCKVGDIIGAAAGYLGQGNYFAHAGAFVKALRYYERTATIARKFDQRHLLGLALSNIGNCHSSMGDMASARRVFGEALTLGEDNGFLDISQHAVQARAVAENDAHNYKAAHQLFLRLADLQRRSGNATERISAIHDAGATVSLAGDNETAVKLFSRARRLAEHVPDEAWVYRCRLAVAITASRGDANREIGLLERAARLEARRGHPLASGQLWEAALGRRVGGASTERAILRGGEAAIETYRAARALSRVVQVYKLLFVWRRETNNVAEALRYARLIGLHTSSVDIADRVAALDEQGCCYQRMGKFKIAEQFHRKALALAETVADTNCLAAPLNNLGLLLRNSGRAPEAIKILERAEELGRTRRDIGLELTAVGNRALALADAGRVREARLLLQAMRKRTERLGLWSQHVDAIHRLANVAYLDGKFARAEALYGEALKRSGRAGEPSVRAEIAENFTSCLIARMVQAFREANAPLAEKLFTVAKHHIKKYKLDSRFRELLVAAGDCYWRLGPRYYFSAARAYLCALGEVPDDPEELLRVNSAVACDLVLWFHWLPEPYGVERVDRLIARVRVWFKAQTKNEMPSKIEEFLLWPFVTGRKVRELRCSGRSSAETVGNLVSEDYMAAVNRLLRRKRGETQ